MFYLETKDGEKFLTDARSDDAAEFEKIVEAKLGRGAAEIFNSLLLSERGYNENIIEEGYCRLKECSDDLDHLMDTNHLPEEVTSRLSDILHEINAICNVLDV